MVDRTIPSTFYVLSHSKLEFQKFISVMFEDTILRSTYRDHGDTCGNAQLSTRLRLWLGRLAMSAGVLLTLSVQYR